MISWSSQSVFDALYEKVAENLTHTDMDGRFIPDALSRWKCRAVIFVVPVNIVLISIAISLLYSKTDVAQEGTVSEALNSAVLEGLHLASRERFAEGSRLGGYIVNWKENRKPGTISALHLGLKQLAVAPQQNHSMSVIHLVNDPEVGTTLMQHFRLQENRIVVVNSSIYYMHTTVLYNLASSVRVRLELEFLKTKTDGSLQTLSRTSIWCKGRQLCSLSLGGTFALSGLDRLHFEANYVQFIIGAIPNSHTTFVHVMGK
ncbi:uncharacterized protein [Haliotis asinina]|uniref:uncharacterized protein isoform X2 n=1 Tax=Haliotis asinina TaxID=109174 RepID=UPI00353258EB